MLCPEGSGPDKLGCSCENEVHMHNATSTITMFVETEQSPIRDQLPDHRLRCYKCGTLTPDDDSLMTNRPIEVL